MSLVSAEVEEGMEAIELRPLTLGELLDRTFSLYRNHFWLFVGIMAIPSIFSIPFNIEFLSARGAATFGGRPPSPTVVADTAVFVLAFFCIFAVVYAIAIGATTFAVSDTYLGRPATVAGSYGKVRHRFWRIIGVVVNVALRMMGILLVGGIGVGIIAGLSVVVARSGAPRQLMAIIVGVSVVLAYLALLVFLLFWSLRYAVSISALLLENIGILAAIRRSVQLTRGRRWQIFIAIFLNMVIGYAGVIIFQGPLMVAMMLSATRGGQLPSWELFCFSILGSIGGAVTMPLLMIVLVLCYYDSRIRKEAFDLQFMMASLDQPSAPAQGSISPA